MLVLQNTGLRRAHCNSSSKGSASQTHKENPQCCISSQVKNHLSSKRSLPFILNGPHVNTALSCKFHSGNRYLSPDSRKGPGVNIYLSYLCNPHAHAPIPGHKPAISTASAQATPQHALASAFSTAMLGKPYIPSGANISPCLSEHFCNVKTLILSLWSFHPLCPKKILLLSSKLLTWDCLVTCLLGNLL